GGAYDEARRARRALRVRGEHLRHGRLAGIALEDVADDADHFVRVAARTDVTADRIALGQPAANGGLVHDHDARGAVDVARIEEPPALERRADRGEVVGRDAGDGNLLVDVRRRRRRAVDTEIENRSLPAH